MDILYQPHVLQALTENMETLERIVQAREDNLLVFQTQLNGVFFVYKNKQVYVEPCITED